MSGITFRRLVSSLVSVLFLIFITAGALPQVTYAVENYSISGTISLPERETAGAGGMAVTIGAESIHFERGPHYGVEKYNKAVVIPEGRNGTAYSITVTRPPDGFSYVIYYVIDRNIYKGYVNIAFYCDRFPGASSQFPITTALDVAAHGDFDGIDMGISKYRKVSGTVELPAGRHAPAGGLDVQLSIVNVYNKPHSSESYTGSTLNLDDIENSAYASVNCKIPEGGDKAAFEFDALEPNERFIGWNEDIGNVKTQSYRLMYRLPGVPGYEWYGFYSKSGTTGTYDDSYEINVTDSDVTGLKFSLLSEESVSNPEKSLDGILAYLDSEIRVDDTVIDMLKDFKTSLEYAASPQSAADMAETAIARLPGVLKKAGSEAYADELKKVTAYIAEKAVEKYGVQKVTATVDGNIVKAVIDQKMLKNFQMASENASKMAQNLTKLLRGSGADEKLETRVTAEIVGSANMKTVKAAISPVVLDMLKAKGTDRFEVSTDIASVALSTSDSSINAASGKAGSPAASTNLQVSLSRIDSKNELNASQQKSVKNDPAYDISVFWTKGNTVQKSIDSFDSPLEIEIPYEIPAGASPEDITVFCIDKKGNMENMSCYYNSIKKTVTFTTKHLCLFTIKEYKVDFKDVSDTKPYYVILQQMASQGIISTSNGNFSPSEGITRAQYVQMLAKSLKIGDLFKGIVDCSFTDIKKADSYYNAIAVCVKAGIVKGSGNRFQPDLKISRQDLAVITARAATVCKNLTTPKDPEKYMDYTDALKILQYAKPPVGLVSKYYVMGPKKEKEFKPIDTVDRIEAALTIYKLMWVQNPEKNPVKGYKELIDG